MKRVIKYASIFGISLFWILFCNIPLLWRLGWVFDVLQGAAVFGIVVGVLGWANPYLVLEKNPPPYKKLAIARPAKKIKSSSPWWPITISIIIDGRNRLERLRDVIIARNATSKDQVENIYESLRPLKIHDFIVISLPEKPRACITYLKIVGAITLEFPLSNNKRNRLLHNQAIRLIQSKNVYKNFSFLSIPLCPTSYYYSDRQSVVIMCKNDYLLATTLGLDLLKQFYHWDGKTKLNYALGNSDDNWWTKC